MNMITKDDISVLVQMAREQLPPKVEEMFTTFTEVALDALLASDVLLATSPVKLKRLVNAALSLIARKHGSGWSDDEFIANLQSRLSIMLEAASRAAAARKV